MTSPIILLLYSVTEYWRFSMYLLIETLYAIVLNYSSQWSPTSTSCLPYPYYQNKLLSVIKKKKKRPYFVFTFMHVAFLALKLRAIITTDVTQCRWNSLLKIRAVQHVVIEETPCKLCGGKKHSIQTPPFSLATAVSHTFMCTLQRRHFHCIRAGCCQRRENLERKQFKFKQLPQIASGITPSRPNNWIVH